jgi:uncharacterized membrane protein
MVQIFALLTCIIFDAASGEYAETEEAEVAETLILCILIGLIIAHVGTSFYYLKTASKQDVTEAVFIQNALKGIQTSTVPTSAIETDVNFRGIIVIGAPRK